MSRLLIAGCGYVGAKLGRAAAASGREVFGVRRRAMEADEGLHSIAADMTDRRALLALPDGIEWLVYAAAADEFTEEAYRRCYGAALSGVVEAMRRQPQLRGAVLLSSTSVYERADGAWVDETSPVDPSHFSGRAMLEAESILRTLPCPTIALRLGYIYGPGRSGIVSAARREAETSASGAGHHENFIHVEDCVRAISFVLEHPSPAETYVVVDEEPALRTEVLAWIRQVLGLAAPSSDGPPLVRSKPPRGDKRCSSARLREAGFRFRYPTYREGLSPLLRGEG